MRGPFSFKKGLVMFTVRTATGADIAGVDALLARAYPRLLKAAYAPSVLVTALPLISRAQPALVTSGRYFVVEEGGAVIGAGGYSRAAPGTGQSRAGLAHVRHVVTDDRAVRRGVGWALLTHVMAQALGDGATRLHCTSTLMAVPFYQAMGFQVVGPVTVPLAPGIDFPAVEMTRGL
jgi:GNAT superfamily N-acetyltransferase